MGLFSSAWNDNNKAASKGDISKATHADNQRKIIKAQQKAEADKAAKKR